MTPSCPLTSKEALWDEHVCVHTQHNKCNSSMTLVPNFSGDLRTKGIGPLIINLSPRQTKAAQTNEHYNEF